jgi:hypothetical protein
MNKSNVKLSKAKLSQWEYTDSNGQQHITPKVGAMAFLLKTYFPNHFYNRIKIDSNTNVKVIEKHLVAMGYSIGTGTKHYINCFLTNKYWSTDWRTILGPQSETIYNNLK